MTDRIQSEGYQAIENTVRQEWGYLFACLMRWLNDFDLAEDILQEALLAALEHWPETGVPASPRAWLLKSAKHKAIDRLRRQKNVEKKHAQIQLLNELNAAARGEDHMLPDRIEDDRLRLIFTCCHPCLAESARIALTLRTLGGLQTCEIAKAFLVSESTMQQRLVRAKTKIRKANIPFSVPGPEQWTARLESVLAVIYLIFNEGYYSSDGDSLVRVELCDEALFLCHMLNRLIPDSPEVMGLLALLLLHDARREARHDASGYYQPLEQQERNLWNQEKIDHGRLWLQKALLLGQPGRYQIQAAISALHTEAKSFAATDWQQIWWLYNRLYALTPNAVVKLNAIIALSYYQDAAAGLKLLEELLNDIKMMQYQPFHAARADMLRRDGQVLAAIESYREAMRLSGNKVERRFLQARCEELQKALI